MSISIKILGTGCTKCQTLTTLVTSVVNENTIEATIEKVEDIMDIMAYNIMTTPALVINETVQTKGRIPSKQEIIDLITSHNNDKKTQTETNCCSTDNCC